MLFNTFQFLVFFVVVLTVFFALPARWRHPFLLAASYYFYMCWSTGYILVIWAITLVDFAVGLLIEKSETLLSRRLLLGGSIVCNFGLLFVLKYADFFGATLNSAGSRLGLPVHIPALHLLLPVGISFHTFQAVSYTIEVYRRRVPAERDLMKYALYVAIFPQMVAGPIERPYNLLPQLDPGKRVSFERFRSGLQTALWGLFKKAVIADLFSSAVAKVYASPQRFPGPILAIATFLFSIQIYCDFSGYSDIAIGIARMMGYDLMINFRTPYFARSIAEFWQRWHISLSTWFRDYLYIPLGGNRVAAARWYVNIVIVFLISGLWHGANWTFVLWGAVHGFYLIVGAATSGLRGRLNLALGVVNWPLLHRAAQTGVTFLLATAAWVFFRANSARDAVYILRHIAGAGQFHLTDLYGLGGLFRFEWVLAALLVVVLFSVEWMIVARPPLILRLWSERVFRWSAYYACIFGIVCFGVFSQVQFIYFQF